ncbi:hypothetical protein EJB05_29917, partial [Eragrostis curvula]
MTLAAWVMGWSEFEHADRPARPLDHRSPSFAPCERKREAERREKLHNLTAQPRTRRPQSPIPTQCSGIVSVPDSAGLVSRSSLRLLSAAEQCISWAPDLASPQRKVLVQCPQYLRFGSTRYPSMSGSQIDSSNHVLLEDLHTEPDVQCLVCTRSFTLDPEVNDSFEALAICRECKMTVLNENNRDGAASIRRERRRRRPRSRATSLESVEAAFSQRLSHLINLAGQGHEADVDSPPVSRQQASFTSTPNRSQRGHASDDESDGLNYVDSVFGETESNFSFGDYGGESDASLDQHG